MRTARLVATLLVLHLAHASLAQQPAQRLITETDLFRFVWVTDPRPSPDGTRVAFTRVAVNEKGEGYDTAIWIVPADGSAPAARLTAGTRDSQPRWSPDGKRIAFLRAPLRDGKLEPPQIHILSLTGGEAWRLTDVPRGTSAAVWSPDGKRIAFTATANAKDLARQRREHAARKTAQEVDVPRPAETAPKPPAAVPDESERESDVRTITRAVYRLDNQGYLDPEHRSHLWTVDVPELAEQPVAARQLTDGKYDEDDPIWSRDGARIYYTSTRIDEPYYELPQSDLFAVPANGGDPEKIAALDFDIGQASLSPDGRTLAFVAEVSRPVRSYIQPDLWVLELTRSATPKNLTADFDFDVGAGIGGDQRAPRGNAGARVVWSEDGKSLVALVAREGRANLMRFPVAGGAPVAVTSGDQAVLSYGASRAGAPLALIISTPTVVGDLWMLDARAAKPRRLTSFNDALFAQLRLTPPEEIWYESFDGKRIHAWAQRPPDFDPSKKYPLILNIHGGPHSAWGYIFTHEFQWMAARGYIVLYPNPRGSSTYGQEFGNIIQYRYPGDDHRDLMAGVDELIRRGWADPQRLGVTGGSGGGLLTNWAVTQTNRFRAAVSQRDIADWSAWWYTADFTLFQPHWFRKAPFEDPADFAQRSPLTHVEKIKTPLMFILGEADYRTPAAAGGESLFRALKYLRRPTAMVRFPAESHELSRSGQPWHRVERLRSILGWMDKYILGKDVAQFRDVTGEGVGGEGGVRGTSRRSRGADRTSALSGQWSRFKKPWMSSATSVGISKRRGCVVCVRSFRTNESRSQDHYVGCHRPKRRGYAFAMADVHTPEERRRNMAQVRARDTAPELALRRLITRMGVRYRLHRKELPGRPDLVFVSRRKVIFVHGCFWHSHSCKAGRTAPATNVTFWQDKRRATVERDQRNVIELRAAGWEALIVWQCDLRDPAGVQRAVHEFLFCSGSREPDRERR